MKSEKTKKNDSTPVKIKNLVENVFMSAFALGVFVGFKKHLKKLSKKPIKTQISTINEIVNGEQETQKQIPSAAYSKIVETCSSPKHSKRFESEFNKYLQNTLKDYPDEIKLEILDKMLDDKKDSQKQK